MATNPCAANKTGKVDNIFQYANSSETTKKYLNRVIQKEEGRLNSKEDAMTALDLIHACVSPNIKANFAEQKLQFC